MAAGTQFTCFTGTKVQILTQQRYAEVKAAQRIAEAAVKKAETGSLRPHTLVAEGLIHNAAARDREALIA